MKKNKCIKYFEVGDLSATEDQLKKILEDKKIEYAVECAKYELSFWRKLFSYGKPWELESFDNYIFDNYRNLWRANYDYELYKSYVKEDYER